MLYMLTSEVSCAYLLVAFVSWNILVLINRLFENHLIWSVDFFSGLNRLTNKIFYLYEQLQCG